MRRSIAAQWRLKIALSMGLTIFFCIPYFTIQRLAVMHARILPLSSLDRAVPFMPDWVWVYQSVYVLLSIVPWFAVHDSDLRRYARGFVLQSMVGFMFFLAIPVAGPRPSAVPADGIFALLVSYDSPLNSFPSLHVGLALYTVLFAAQISRDRLSPAWRMMVLGILAAWVTAIAFATLATKQHYAVDLPAGALLAWLSFRVSSPEFRVLNLRRRSGLQAQPACGREVKSSGA